ncbi:hypothetical protein [Compostimonas suwonensis]|uniref:Uncharacterized protein n=1 Tax=Compostimonas suwonensis TaxID=1048394 RepID=A0A2M9C064_9MICO|nr:hypothetical protein [Compostimonas suwonensis]PJJ63719.1 hypothetical protein CLV54_1392 [Compostimonas suwonensis]
MSTPPELSPERRAAMREWVMDYVETRKRRRRRFTIAGISLVSAGALTAAAWIVLAPPVVQEQWVFCYEEPSLDAHHSEGIRDEPGGDRVANALDMCGTLWKAGILGGDGTPVSSTPTMDFPLPNLTLCVRPDNTLAVFPTDPGTDTATFCSALGLATDPAS